MVSYHEAIWKDCHDYDEISPEDLDNFEEAYSIFCDADSCDIGQGAAENMLFEGEQVFVETAKTKILDVMDVTDKKCAGIYIVEVAEGDSWNQPKLDCFERTENYENHKRNFFERIANGSWIVTEVASS